MIPHRELFAAFWLLALIAVGYALLGMFEAW